MSIKALASRIRSERIKSLIFFEKNAFSYGKRIVLEDFNSKRELKIPEDIKHFLLELGEGDINDLHIHGIEHVYPFGNETGAFEGLVTFASDAL